MLPYIMLLSVSFIFPLIIFQKRGVFSTWDSKHINYSKNNMTIFLFFVGLFILLALRNIAVGKDLIVYEMIFNACSEISFKNIFTLDLEVGYILYNKLIYILFKEYRALLVITALISVCPLYILYSKEKRYSILLLAIYINMPCFLMIFSGLRQTIAMSIGIFVYMLIERKKYILSLLLILLAVTFHTSAAILLLLYPAFFIKIKAKHLFYIVPGLLLIYIFKTQIFMFVVKYIPKKYGVFYSELEQTGAFGMLLLFLVFFIFSFVITDEKAISKSDYFLRNIIILAMAFQVFVPIHGLVQRASYYFLLFVPIAILSVVNAPKKRLKNISNIAVIVMSCFFTVYFFYHAVFSTDNLLDVFPYRFFWSN